MTIDEAIAHARVVAKRRMAEYENHYDKDTHYYPTQCKKCAEEHIQLAEWLEELKQYRTIGTPEECRAAMGRQNPIAAIAEKEDTGTTKYTCPTCGRYLGWSTGSLPARYCWKCGQKLDWSDEE